MALRRWVSLFDHIPARESGEGGARVGVAGVVLSFGFLGRLLFGFGFGIGYLTMDADIITGIVVLVLALGVLTGLVLWSRRIIERIASSDAKTAREILRELRDES